MSVSFNEDGWGKESLCRCVSFDANGTTTYWLIGPFASTSQGVVKSLV